MYTVCPGCTRQFQVLAEHLAVASGQVRCGFCHEQFNAMDRLYDEPVSREKILQDQALYEDENETVSTFEIEPQIEEEPEFDISEAEEIEQIHDEQDVSIADVPVDVEQGLETAISEIGIRPSVDDIKAKLKKETGEPEKDALLDEPIVLEIDVEPDAERHEVEKDEQLDEPIVLELDDEPGDETFELKHDESVASLVQEPEEEVEEESFDFLEPEAIFEDDEPVNSRWSWLLPFFWTTMTMIALLAIAIQLVWFNRDEVLLKYPQLMPYAKQICSELDCNIIRQQDSRAIKLINRDVRLHPDYQDTLLVNAAMKNELSVRQPYPKVQLTLFDTSGSLLGFREFVPGDYLDGSIEIDKGMPIDTPVYFVLEVSGPTAGAVSFEFRFL